MAFLDAFTKANMVRTFEEAFSAPDMTSGAMKRAIMEWFGLYYGSRTGGDPAQRIPFIIVDGVYKAAFGEYRAQAGGSGGKDRLLAPVLQKLDKIRGAAFQRALIGGEGFIKPVVVDGSFAFSFIDRRGMVVLGRDVEGNITDLGCASLTVRGKERYTLLERRRVDGDGFLTIENKLYKSDAPGVLGSPAPLDSIEEYAGLEAVSTLPLPLRNLGMAALKTPLQNCVDGGPDGVSIYAAAVGKILTQYGHEKRTQDEYDVTVPALYMSEDEFLLDDYGRPVVPKYARAVDDEPRNVGRFVYNPAPNQAQLEARANQNLRDIENIIGLRRGFLSNVDSEERTATEVISSSAKFAHNISLLQEMWAGAVKETLRTCDILGQIYLGWNAAKYAEPIIDWGDGVLYDEQQDFERHLALAQNGIEKPEILLGWLNGMPADTAEEQAAVKEKYGVAGGK